MAPTFYNRFIKPHSKDSDQAEREIVLNYLLIGIWGLSVVAFIVTLLGPPLSHAPFHPVRLFGNFLTVLFIVGLYAIARYRQQYKPVAVVLTLLIALFGCFVAQQWSLWDPQSVLLLSLAIVMAGILIGARYSLYVTLGVVIVMAYLQNGEARDSLHPRVAWLRGKPAPGDVMGYAAILFVIAFVSWLFNRQIELSLRRARRSEKALQRQKALLEVKVQQRTEQLEAAQLQQMQELYRFAELGRLSTALFHDLANHVATVSLDIEGLKNQNQSGIMQRIHENVQHIDGVVQRVRQQIQGKSTIEPFNVLDEINEIMRMLSFSADKAGVTLTLQPGTVRPLLLYKGDPIRFRQLLLNLVCNGIEAYPDQRGSGERSVMVALERVQTRLTISVTDHGLGVSPERRTKIFEPFYTTKTKGVGIGLFVVKQVVEHDFGGTIGLTSDKQGTTFSVTLPKSYYAKVA